jgi:enterochelin esterase-like enzyme
VRAPGLQQRTFFSAAAGAMVSYHVYLPRAYDLEPERRFPVLYWLHGGGGGVAGLRQLVQHYGGAMDSGRVPPMVVVFPNGLELGMWIDSRDGRTPVETVFVEELVPLVDAAFRTLAVREARILEGFSMGGYGAARLAFRHHHLFGAASILAGGPLQREFTRAPRVGHRQRDQVLRTVYGGDHDHFIAQSPWVLAEQNARTLAAQTQMRVVIGTRDEMLEINREFHAHLTGLGIPHGYTELAGIGHDPAAMLAAMGEDHGEFHRRVLGNRYPDQPPP